MRMSCPTCPTSPQLLGATWLSFGDFSAPAVPTSLRPKWASRSLGLPRVDLCLRVAICSWPSMISISRFLHAALGLCSSLDLVLTYAEHMLTLFHKGIKTFRAKRPLGRLSQKCRERTVPRKTVPQRTVPRRFVRTVPRQAAAAAKVKIYPRHCPHFSSLPNLLRSANVSRDISTPVASGCNDDEARGIWGLAHQWNYFFALFSPIASRHGAGDGSEQVPRRFRGGLRDGSAGRIPACFARFARLLGMITRARACLSRSGFRCDAANFASGS